MKKGLFSLLIVALVLQSVIFSVQADPLVERSYTQEQIKCIDFLSENHITPPTSFKSEDAMLEFVEFILSTLEENPNIEFTFGFLDYQTFAEQIKICYVGGENTINSTLESSYTLQYNTFYEYPANCLNFNCYSYAIDRRETWHIIGEPSGNRWQDTWTIEESANAVEADLKTFGYSCVKQTISRPRNYTISSGQKAIALKVTSVTSLNRDFHFMRLFTDNNTDVWRHKPGSTAILTYNSMPSNSPWYSEYVTKVGTQLVAGLGNIIYDSDVMFLIFQANHTIETVETGMGYHQGNIHYTEYREGCLCGYHERYYYLTRYCEGPCPILYPFNEYEMEEEI